MAYAEFFEQKTIDEEHATFIDAAAHGDFETVRDIIQSGSSEPQKIASLINARDDDGFSVLTHAVTEKQFAIIDYLLTCRADPNSPDNFGSTPLHVAASMGGSAGLIITKKLVSHDLAKLDAQMHNGATPLLLATQGSHTRIVRRLLSAKANPNVPGPLGSTCLHLAVLQTHRNLLRVLLKGRADPNLADDAGMTPILVAVEENQQLFVRKLLVAQADLTAKTTDGSTALHLAASLPHPGVLRLLLDAGVTDVNAQDGRGNTAMILAAENPVSCSMDMVRALVEDGGDMNTRNDDGESASEVLWQTHRVQLKLMVSPSKEFPASKADEALMLNQSQLLQRAQYVFQESASLKRGRISCDDFTKALVTMEVKSKLGHTFGAFMNREFQRAQFKTQLTTELTFSFEDFIEAYNRSQQHRYRKSELKKKEMKRRRPMSARHGSFTVTPPSPRPQSPRVRATLPGVSRTRPQSATPLRTHKKGSSLQSTNLNARNEARLFSRPAYNRQRMISLVKDELKGVDPFRMLITFINDKVDEVLESKPNSATRVKFIRDFFNQKSSSILGKARAYSYVEKARKVFRSVDVNHDGILDVSEFSKFASKICKKVFSEFDSMGLRHPKEVDIKSDFKALDVDNNGKLDFDEFYRFMQVIMLTRLASSIDEKLELVASGY